MHAILHGITGRIQVLIFYSKRIIEYFFNEYKAFLPI